tara:strand:- start:483 stop:896 length:414 start_codon:yes stop_codon:yes gene_type:complete
MYYETEIQNIISNIEPTEYKNLKTIIEIRENVIYSIYERFMNYNQNVINLEEAMELLEKYEFILKSDLKNDDYFRFFNVKRCFFNIKLSKMFKVKDIKDGVYIFRDIKKLPEDAIIFRKISTNDYNNLKLLDIVNGI